MAGRRCVRPSRFQSIRKDDAFRVGQRVARYPQRQLATRYLFSDTLPYELLGVCLTRQEVHDAP